MELKLMRGPAEGGPDRVEDGRRNNMGLRQSQILVPACQPVINMRISVRESLDRVVYGVAGEERVRGSNVLVHAHLPIFFMDILGAVHMNNGLAVVPAFG